MDSADLLEDEVLERSEGRCDGSDFAGSAKQGL